MAACAHVTSVTNTPDQLTAEQKQEILTRQEKRTKVSGTGFVSFSMNGKSTAAPGVLLVEWPDRLRLEIQDPIGSILALLIVNGDSFWWENRETKEALTGKVNHPELEKLLPFPVNPKFLIPGIMGRPNLEDEINISAYWKEVIHWKLKNDADVFFEDYAMRLGVQYPTVIRMLSGNKEEQKKLEWQWKDWQPEQKIKEKNFQIPLEASKNLKLKKLF